MLASFLLNQLMWCLMLLFAGWGLDLLSAWLRSPRHRAVSSNRASTAARAHITSSHLSVCGGA